MFLPRQMPPPLPPPPDPNGVKLEIKLSEAAFIKLVAIMMTVLLGSGVWVAQSASPPAAAPINPVEMAP